MVVRGLRVFLVSEVPLDFGGPCHSVRMSWLITVPHVQEEERRCLYKKR